MSVRKPEQHTHHGTEKKACVPTSGKTRVRDHSSEGNTRVSSEWERGEGGLFRRGHRLATSTAKSSLETGTAGGRPSGRRHRDGGPEA